jgi:hypothetical protein
MTHVEFMTGAAFVILVTLWVTACTTQPDTTPSPAAFILPGTSEQVQP